MSELPKNGHAPQEYEWLTPQQAVLLRPDAYVGGLDAIEEETTILQADGTSKLIKYVMSPILMKIVDEVIVNALDCGSRDPQVRNIRFTFNFLNGMIEVENDGDGIEIKLFKNTDRYIPSVIFSELHAGSNFRDEHTRFTGGRNGVGASCTNIWSTMFEVEVQDTKKKFFQRFRDNLRVTEAPQIINMPSKAGKVRIRFIPDYKRLNICLSEHHLLLNDLFRTRCSEISICARSGITVYFQDEKMPSKPSDLLKSLCKCDNTVEERCGDPYGSGCTICIGWKSHGLDYYGFINGVRCDSGTLANLVRDRLIKCVVDQVRKKQQVTVRPQTVKDVLGIVCVARVPNPRFTSQAKTTLSTTARDLGFQVDLNQKFGTKLSKLGVIDEILRRESDRELNASLRKALVPKSKDVLIDKYDPALDCKRDAENCTLILTEGDSAKAFVVAGVSAIGREKFGIFPLRGVPLNVTNLPVPKLLENKEVSNIFKILNVAPFSDGRGLRYGRVAISSDQDCDGSHICGLIINLLCSCLPDVIKDKPNFVQRIVTPLIKATNKKKDEKRAFFSKQEFDTWQAEQEDLHSWNFKYYKGLGTSTSKEAREVFRDLGNHSIKFEVDDKARDTLTKFYDDTRSDDRKNLLTTEYDPHVSIDYTRETCKVTDFMLKEHVHFSHYMLYRALPSMIDGLTPSRRKVLFYFLQKRGTSEEKVAQAASGVAQKTLYLHGETSLVETMIGLAQDFCGTNNIALLQGIGQFGCRNDKPSVHAAARYIFTCLDSIARFIYPTADEPVLEYRVEEGEVVEPKQYIPIIPMILVNGAQGIGTGFATCVPCFSVTDLITCCKSIAQGEPQPNCNLRPFYRGFSGRIEISNKGVITHGILHKNEINNSISITELPIQKWTDPFLSELKACAEGIKTIKGLHIVTATNMSTDTKVNIEVTFSEENQNTTEEEFAKLLKLSSSIPTTYMYGFDATYTLKHYSTIEPIIKEHAAARLDLYERRKAHLLCSIEKKIVLNTAKEQFIDMVINDQISIRGQAKEDLVGKIREKGLPPLPTKNDSEGFEYLLSISVSAFTKERVENLKLDVKNLNDEKDLVSSKTSSEMWYEELSQLELEYAKYEDRHQKRQNEEENEMNSKIKEKAKKRPKTNKDLNKIPSKRLKK